MLLQSKEKKKLDEKLTKGNPRVEIEKLDLKKLPILHILNRNKNQTRNY